MLSVASRHEVGTLIVRSKFIYSASIISSKRFQSSVSQDDKAKIINHDSIYVLSIPITTSRSYIYCNHKPTILDSTQKQKFPLVTKIESKVMGIATKGWDKLSNSKQSVNIKITNFIKRLLSTIPYEENCLKSFPSKSAMIREINEESIEEVNKKLKLENPTSALVQTQIQELQIKHDQVKPIPLYHPSFQKPTTILTQLYNFRDEAHSKHLKYSILCAIGIPISLPFALVPVVPNVPGFYIAYRLYCNVKALMGVKHLNYLLENSKNTKKVEEKDGENYKLEAISDESTISDTEHLAFKTLNDLDSIYKKEHSSDVLVEHVQEEERIIISKEIIEDLTSQLNMGNLKDDLLKALKQETARLNKNLKINDAVE
ncbi:mitochondrial K+-H+ exchange-related-domain-containing protein [Scheffersomyces xylosifermentans]|uniref:mitochondrial K+-H+ exchange-related-domain-containing protein n=1 Tax=Scheffersomyces xylosifermentans TaxID=1304137 RepID=UPI00315DB302